MVTIFDGFQECKIAGSKQGSFLEYWPCSRRPYNKCAYCLANTGIRIEHHHSSIKPDVRTKEMKNQQTDSRGGSRGRVQGCAPPPEMTCGFLIQLVFCQKIYIPGFFENRVSKDKGSFYYLTIKNNMSTSISTQIPNQKAATTAKKTPKSAVNSIVNKPILVDRRSCEKLHKKLDLPARFS